MKNTFLFYALLFLLPIGSLMAQQPVDTIKKLPQYKNVIRYNLSGGLLFGIDKYVVLGYERVINPRQSISLNVGRASLPKLVSISTDSFNVDKDRKRSGFNASVDYRFYLGKENKYAIPHGVYIGPYYSYNHYTSETQWNYKNSSTGNHVNAESKFNIHTVGFELGYQFILWKRVALDLVMIGPGVGFYDCKATFDSNLSQEKKEQLLDGIKDLLTQKFPGMNYVFSDEEFDGNGVMSTNSIGYRYIIHIGFLF